MASEVAVRLLAQIAGYERVGREPAAANELVELCAGLPLAVRIAAARLTAHPTWTVAGLTRQLADESRRLDELSHGDQAVRPTLALAYQGLSPMAADAFLLLGAIGAPSFPGWSISALLGVAPDVASDILRELLDARLLDELGQDSAGQLRYRLHQLTALFARERSVVDLSAAARSAAMTRAGKAWHALASQARLRLHCQRMLLDDPPEADADPDAQTVQLATAHPIAWFEAERETITAMVDATASAGLAAVTRQLAGCAAEFQCLRGNYSDWHRCMEAALAACRDTGDDRGEAVVLRGLGSCLIELDDLECAASTLSAAKELANRIGDPRGAALAAQDHAFVMALSGRLAEAEQELLETIPQLTGFPLRQAEAIALTSLAFVHRQQGRLDVAVRDARAALVAARSCGDRFAEAYACRGLAGALVQSGRLRSAQRVARRAVASFDAIGDPIGAGQSLRTLGEALTGDPERSPEARRALMAAASIFRDRGFVWGICLAELSLAELELLRDGRTSVERLDRCLEFWTREKVPALTARTLVALARATEGRDGPKARRLLKKAHQLYVTLDPPQAASIAARLRPHPSPGQPGTNRWGR
jgi:tetratricopeptide (TPR) repeat protein